jgi:prepilin-type N-terminal cleavage/methylation domain-containing protein/prepilin-type processing-associated H-X9-DG protein
MKRMRGFTLIELLVVIAVIAIIAAILFPVFAQTREKARAATCLSNVKQIGSAMLMYAQDYDEAVPPWLIAVAPGRPLEQASWTYLMQPYLRNGAPAAEGGRFVARDVMRCPSYSEANFLKAADIPECGGGYYGMRLPATHVFATYGIAWPDPVLVGNGTQPNPYRHSAGSGLALPVGGLPTGSDLSRVFFVQVRLAAVVRPAETAMLTDALTWVTGGRRPGLWQEGFGCEGAEAHSGGGNIGFFDGHAKWIARNPERYLKQRADGKWFDLYFAYDIE